MIMKQYLTLACCGNKMKVNPINLTGTFKEYVDYKNRNKLKPNQIQAIIIFGFCLFGVVLVIFLIQDISYVKPVGDGAIVSWIKSAPILAKTSWNTIAKYLVILFAPVIVLSWLIHGVQARLFA